MNHLRGLITLSTSRISCQASQRQLHQQRLVPPLSCWQPHRGYAAEAPGDDSDGAQSNIERRKLVSSLLYRSRQRGFLELDLLVGLWAQKHVPAMDIQALKEFQQVLEEENPDLFKWLTGQEPAPKALADNQAFQAMFCEIQKQLQDTRPDIAKTAQGKPWVRGWDDWKQQELVSN